MLYFKIHPVQGTIMQAFKRPLPIQSYNTKALSLVNGKPYLVEPVVTDPPYDPATQVKEGPVDSYDGVTATRVYTVRDKTAQELAAEERTNDIRLLTSATKDAILVLVEVIEWQLANTAMAPSDFSPDVRQAFLDIQVIANRLR